MARYHNELLNSAHIDEITLKPRYPRYETFEAREQTFKDLWPKKLPVHRLNLITAGLFYTGLTDCVICHQCGGGFQNLVVDDKLVDLHATLFGVCPFLLRFNTKETIESRVDVTPTFKQLDKAFIPSEGDFILLNKQNHDFEIAKMRKQIETLKRLHKREMNVTLTEANSCIREVSDAKNILLLKNRALAKEVDEIANLLECQVCMTSRKDRILYCGHAFCNSCIGLSKNCCPVCRRHFSFARRLFW